MPALRFLSPDTAFNPEIQNCSNSHTHLMVREQHSTECVPSFTQPLVVGSPNASLPLPLPLPNGAGLVKLVALVVSCGADIRGLQGLSPAQSFIPHLMGAGKLCGMEKQQHSSAHLNSTQQPTEPPRG